MATRLLLTLVCCAVLPLALAQQNRATIFGTVTDSTGATASGVKITVVNVTTNTVFSTVTGEEGFFSAPALAVGQYQLSAEQSGFKKAVRSGITLEVDQRAR